MKQKKTKCLSISSLVLPRVPGQSPIGRPVVVLGNNVFAEVIEEAPIGIVGTVVAIDQDDSRATIETRFRERRDDREGVPGLTHGPFVWDADGKAVSYIGAVPAMASGTEIEPFAPVADTSDAVKVKVGDGDSQTFILAETDISAVLVAEKINATAVGFTASAANGSLVLTVNDIVSDLEIEAVANDAYTVLGLTVGVIHPTERSHDPAAIAGLVIKLPAGASVTSTVAGPYDVEQGTNDALKLSVGGGASQDFTLTAGLGRTPQQICDDINATAVGFQAVVVPGSLVKLVAQSPWEAIEIEAVANDAYDTLGFTVGVVAAPTIIETLEK